MTDSVVGFSSQEKKAGRALHPTSLSTVIRGGSSDESLGAFYPTLSIFPKVNSQIPSRLTPVNRDSWTCLPLAFVVQNARVGLGSGPGRRLEGSTRSVRGVGVRPAPTKRS